MSSVEASPSLWNQTLLKLQKFFFTEERPYGMALLRITLPLALLTLVIPRWFYARELYSTDGAIAQLASGFGFPNFVPEFSGTIAVALYTLLTLCLICTSIGWQSRIAMIVSFVLFNYFSLLDVLGTISKLTVIAGHGLLLLSVSPAGEIWSVDAWLKRRRVSQPTPHVWIPRSNRHPIWAQRLVQLLIAIIYFAAAITKVHTAAYFSGDQMTYWLVTNINGPKPVGEFMTEYPGFLVLSSYIGFVWEVLFIFLCWSLRGRRWMVGMGVMFHAGTFFMLGLQSFPLVMFCMYLSFLEERDVRWGMSLSRKLFRRTHNSLIGFIAYGFGVRSATTKPLGISPATSLMGFLVVALTTVALGIEGEKRFDLYGKNRPEGPYTLPELAPEEVETLLAETEPIRDFDKVFAFELGTLELGGKLWNRRHEYRPGERIICEVALNPPHEDMWIECALMNSAGRTLTRPGDTALRENLRTFFTFNLAEDIEPGEYSMVLFSRGEEVIRRDFKILGDSSESNPVDSNSSESVAPLAN